MNIRGSQKLVSNGWLTPRELLGIIPDLVTMLTHDNEEAALLALEELEMFYELEMPDPELSSQQDFRPTDIKKLWKRSLAASAAYQRRKKFTDPESHLRCGQVGTASAKNYQAESLQRSILRLQLPICVGRSSIARTASLGSFQNTTVISSA